MSKIYIITERLPYSSNDYNWKFSTQSTDTDGFKQYRYRHQITWEIHYTIWTLCEQFLKNYHKL